MMIANEEDELIERYLSGNLSRNDRARLARRLEIDENLRMKVNAELIIRREMAAGRNAIPTDHSAARARALSLAAATPPAKKDRPLVAPAFMAETVAEPGMARSVIIAAALVLLLIGSVVMIGRVESASDIPPAPAPARSGIAQPQTPDNPLRDGSGTPPAAASARREMGRPGKPEIAGHSAAAIPRIAPEIRGSGNAGRNVQQSTRADGGRVPEAPRMTQPPVTQPRVTQQPETPTAQHIPPVYRTDTVRTKVRIGAPPKQE